MEKRLIENSNVVTLAQEFKNVTGTSFSFFEPKEWITSVVEFIIYLCEENIKLKKEIAVLRNGKK